MFKGAWRIFYALLLPYCLAYQQQGLQSNLQSALNPHVAYYGLSPAHPGYIWTVYPAVQQSSEIRPERYDVNYGTKQPGGVFYPMFAPYPQIPAGHGYASHVSQPITNQVNHVPTQQQAYHSFGASPSSPAIADRNSEGSLQLPIAIPQPAPFPEELLSTFRGFEGTQRARASLRISSDNRMGEAYFYQPTPSSDVFVAVTGAPGATTPPAELDIVVLTGDPTTDCNRRPVTSAANFNPIFNPQNVVRGGVLVTDFSPGNQKYAFVSDKIPRNSISLWGSNTIVGRYLLVAGRNNNPGAGAAQICGKIVSL